MAVRRAPLESGSTVDVAAADATLHPGAVYLHQGATFVVDELHQAHDVVHEATVFVHDAHPGRAGFAERGFRLGAT